MRIPAYLILCASVFFLCLGGCAALPSHVHSDRREKIAKDAQQTIQSLDDDSSNVFSAMSENVEKFRVYESDLVAAFAANNESAEAERTPTITMSNWPKKLQAFNERVDKAQGSITKKAKEYLAKQKIAQSQTTKLEEDIQQLEIQVKDAKDQVNRWNATVAVLQTAMAKVPPVLASGKVGGSAGSLFNSVAAIGEEEIEFVNANGEKEKITIKKFLVSQAESFAAGKLDLSKFDVPGMTVRILTLGLEIAEANRDAANARLHAIGQRFAAMGDAAAQLSLARAVVTKEDRAILQSQNELEANPEGTSLARAITNHVLRARLLRNKAYASIPPTTRPTSQESDAFNDSLTEAGIQTDNAASILLAVRHLVVATAIAKRADLAFQLEMRRLDHEDSIREAHAASKLWRVVTRGGIDGLASYEAGGLTAEEAANIVRIAQTVALGVIASK